MTRFYVFSVAYKVDICYPHVNVKFSREVLLRARSATRKRMALIDCLHRGVKKKIITLQVNWTLLLVLLNTKLITGYCRIYILIKFYTY